MSVVVFFATAFLGDTLNKVSADIIPLTVSVDHIDFGKSFPGENREGSFSVLYSLADGNENYNIEKQIKPLPGAQLPLQWAGGGIRMYCQGNSTDYTRCYKDLCPYLDIVSLEGENDLITGAQLGYLDMVDDWTIYFKVPAIVGTVAQDHDGGIVSVNGEYGCDLVIVVDSYCGDYRIDYLENEECDDGPNGSATCTSDCKTIIIPPGPYCGDGVQNQQTEDCDDGINNGTASSTCSVDCKTIPDPICGDGVKNQPTEDCDDGVDNGTASSTCSIDCKTITTPEPYCGDGAVNQTSEDCDDGVDNGTASSTCSVNCETMTDGPYCGDGAVNQTSEDCDDGVDNGTASSTCSIDCKTETVDPTCGDGEINQEFEQCDDGNNVDNDGCSATCVREYCGDNICNAREDCSLCSQDCGSCGGGCNGPGCYYTPPRCGDGSVNRASEECDDGNKIDGDGCDANCIKEIIVKGEEGEPYLVIEKERSQEYVNPGDVDIKYTVVVANNGKMDAFDVVVGDKLPKGFLFADTLKNAREWKFDSLGSGKSIKLEYLVNVGDGVVEGLYTNIASVKAVNHEELKDDADVKVKEVQVLGVELIPTGFSTKEFVGLLSILLIISMSIIVLKRKEI